MLWRRENQRASLEHMRQRARIVLRIGRCLGERQVARCVDEFAKLTIGHRRPVDPKAAHRDAMSRRLFRIVLVGAHAEGAARNPGHVRMVGLMRLGSVRCKANVAHGFRHRNLMQLAIPSKSEPSPGGSALDLDQARRAPALIVLGNDLRPPHRSTPWMRTRGLIQWLVKGNVRDAHLSRPRAAPSMQCEGFFSLRSVRQGRAPYSQPFSLQFSFAHIPLSTPLNTTDLHCVTENFFYSLFKRSSVRRAMAAGA